MYTMKLLLHDLEFHYRIYDEGSEQKSRLKTNHVSFSHGYHKCTFVDSFISCVGRGSPIVLTIERGVT